MGASEKAAATYHPRQGTDDGWLIVTATDARYRVVTREFPLPAEITAATITTAIGALIGSRTVDADRLLVAMRDQMTEADSWINDPERPVPKSIAIATSDAFGTVLDWVEDTYLPGVTR